LSRSVFLLVNRGKTASPMVALLGMRSYITAKLG
jgi:hypothetical protein